MKLPVTTTAAIHYTVRDANDRRMQDNLHTIEYTRLRVEALNRCPPPGYTPPFRAVRITTTSTIEELTP